MVHFPHPLPMPPEKNKIKIRINTDSANIYIYMDGQEDPQTLKVYRRTDGTGFGGALLTEDGGSRAGGEEPRSQSSAKPHGLGEQGCGEQAGCPRGEQ